MPKLTRCKTCGSMKGGNVPGLNELKRTVYSVQMQVSDNNNIIDAMLSRIRELEIRESENRPTQTSQRRRRLPA